VWFVCVVCVCGLCVCVCVCGVREHVIFTLSVKLRSSD